MNGNVWNLDIGKLAFSLPHRNNKLPVTETIFLDLWIVLAKTFQINFLKAVIIYNMSMI